MSASPISSNPKRLVGYFPSWGIHVQNYHVTNIPADRLTHLIYAFANVTATGDCISTNAQDDQVNFPQLAALKQQHPQLLVLISVGGATNSANFSSAAATDASRLHFAQSCVQFMKKNGFDGIDIDWEYPAATDKSNYTALLTQLRRQLVAQGSTDNRQYLLTIAAPAGASNYANFELNLIHPTLDWINLMAYNFTLPSRKLTDFCAPLKAYDLSVATHAAENVDAAVQAYLKAGVPAAKVVVGTHFAGIGWQGVANNNNGLYQANTGPAKGTWDGAGAAPSGSLDYKDIATNYLPKYSRFWHSEAQVPWLYNPNTGILISYDDPQSLDLKANYVLSNQLGGIMIWELSADDAQASLTSANASVFAPSTGSSRVEGHIFFDHGLPAAGIPVRLYNRAFAGADSNLAGGSTDSQGYYSLSYNPGAGSVNLQVRTLDTQGQEIALSTVKFNAAPAEVLDLVAPSTNVQPLTPEFQRLAAEMDKAVGGVAKLGQAEESVDRQDLSLLYQNTGWDARLIALAASAANLIQPTGLGHDLLYALLRAGLPSDPQQLCLVSPTAVQKALSKANQSGIVSLSDQQISAATTTFTSFARTARLNLAAAGANSTFGDLLSQSGLSADQRTAFADLYFASSSVGDGLWQKATSLGLPAATLDALKLQGKLAYLTFNNAGLTQKLQQDTGSLNNLSQLPEKDFHTNTAWKNYLTALAGTSDPQALDKLIPSGYQGKTTSDRLEAYAADLARKVRLSFPSQVVGRMIETGNLAAEGNRGPLVAAFLKNATPLGFQLGRTPLNSFIKQNQAKVFQGIADIAGTTQSVKTLHRLYQITPTDESLQAAAKLGFTSAYDVASFSHDEFIKYFGSQFPSLAEAELVYRKAQQVSSVVLNAIAFAKQLDSAPAMQATSPASPIREAAKAAVVEQFPTMESLFGSLDFCDCEDCQSVLSPAAYLVDILRFIDPPDVQWNAFLNQWKTEHNGANYTDKYDKPYDALVLRRPDLPHLPLTCENTNTVLPYIDVVNEILEYYIANGALDSNAAYDTGGALTDDLLAEPQNILPAAYSILSSARYPLGLPFDLWIETVRAFLGYFQQPLSRILEVFRPADALELFSDSNHYPYYRAAMLAELLDISPAEYALFTDPTALANWFQLFGYNDAASAVGGLKSAKTLSQRLGVSYQDLTNLIGTGFVNPQVINLVTLQKLGVQPDAIFSYESQAGYTPMTSAEKAAFEALLDGLTKKYNPSNAANGFNARNWLSTTWSNGGFNQILLLFYQGNGCNFDATTLQYANETPADPIALLKINLFVRIWKKLGWSMEETDLALRVFLSPFFPLATDANFGADFAGAMKSALVYLAHLQALEAKLQPGPYGRIGLLPFWSNLPTTGASPLYAQLFLDPTLLQNDPVFDNPTGNYLSDSTVLTKDHLLAVQGALGLTADEVELILADTGLDLTTAPLSLGNVSLLYRYKVLARGLQLGVSDLVAVKGMSGLNPFAPLNAKPMAVLADDAPLNQTLAFVDAVQKVQGSGFAIEDLKYLLRHQFDPVGKYSSDPNVLTQLIRSLANTVHLIQSDNAIPADPLTFTDNVIKQKMALAFSSDVAQSFMGMWTGTLQYTAVQKGVPPANLLNPATLTQFPEIQVSYDPVANAQQLAYTGVLLDAQKSQIEAANSSPVLAALLNAVQAQAQDFFQKYLQVSSIGQEPIGFLPAADFNILFAPVAPGTSDAPKRQELAKMFLPYLQQNLIRQAILQAMAGDLSADASLTEALLTNATLLSNPSHAGNSLLGAFAAAAQNGVSSAYFASSNGSGPALGSGTAVTTDTADTAQPKPAGTNSAHFEGYLEVPSDAPYRFFAELGKQNAQVSFQFDFLASPLLLGVAGNAAAEIAGFVELKAGIPYHFTFDVQNLGGGDASLLVQGETMPKGSLTQLTLYPQSVVDGFARARVLVSKSLQLIRGFNLTEKEVIYLLTQSADFNNLSLSALPTQSGDDSPAKAAALFGQFLRLAAYSALKQGPAGGSDGLINVFENARQTFLGSADPNQSAQTVMRAVCQAMADLTRRDIKTIQATAQQLGFSAQSQVANGQLLVQASAFTQEKGVERLWNALQAVQTIGIPVSSLAGATAIVDGNKTPDARSTIASTLKNAVKAHFTIDSWRPIAKSIFDKLRQEKRDAVCAYLVQKLGLENNEQLFEFFLVDPGMEPIVTTSRIRLAISSVQTFIQRCLLNLEAKVAPSAIKSSQWEWLKRYRVSEANKKIFLWPEDWMIPELRLDKTDLFQTLESALLQGDVTNDLVEDALFTYLKGLQERARLDIVTMYLDEASGDPGSNILHVIGRNHGRPQKYFYRRFAFSTWTAWEPVTVDIEGDHIAAVVWRDRLHLFWLTFAPMSQPPTTAPQGTGSDSGTHVADMTFSELSGNLFSTRPPKQNKMQLNWSEYFQGKWTDRRSSDLNREGFRIVADDFDPSSTYIHVSKEYDDSGNEGAVLIQLSYDGLTADAFRVVSKNSEPALIAMDEGDGNPQDVPYNAGDWSASKYSGSGALHVSFAEQIETQDGQVIKTTRGSQAILQQGGDFTLLICDSPVTAVSLPTTDPFLDEAGALSAPFFYEDLGSDTTFFVQPLLTETSVDQWPSWVISVSTPDPNMASDDWWKTIPIISQVPLVGAVSPGNPYSVYQVQPRIDWTTHPATVLSFGPGLIGATGGVHVVKTVGLGLIRPGQFPGVIGNGKTTGVLRLSGGANLNRVGEAGLTTAALQNFWVSGRGGISNLTVKSSFNQLNGVRR
jgi:GH18 family chitinase